MRTYRKSPMPRCSWSRAAWKHNGKIIRISIRTPSIRRAQPACTRNLRGARGDFGQIRVFSSLISPTCWNRRKNRSPTSNGFTERLPRTVSPSHCVGKGGKASCRLLLNPDQSGNLKTILHHSVEDFRLELPGPSWLVGLLVSRDAIETSIRTGLRDLAREIDERLRRRAIALFTNQVQTTETALARPAGQYRATLTLERLRYPVLAGQGGSSSGDRAIAGDVCLGFPTDLPRSRTAGNSVRVGWIPLLEKVLSEPTW